MTLARIDYEDQITGQKSFEAFEYAGGNYYYDAADLYGREYAGFYQTTVTDDTGNRSTTYFHQSQTSTDGTALGEWQDHISKKGRSFREEIADKDGHILQTKITKWMSVPKGNDRYLVVPESTTNIAYKLDGVAHVDSAEKYSYDIYGNEIDRISYGLVTADPNTGIFTDIGNDKREIQTSYAINIEKNLLQFPWQTTLLSGSGDIVAKSEKIYDSLSGGSVEIGLTSEDRSWKEASSIVSTRYVYNDKGLPTAVTDANGNTSTYQYDDYDIYPISTKNPL